MTSLPRSAVARIDASRALEASDDLVLRILGHLTLKERFRLTTVSRRWLRLALAELRFIGGMEQARHICTIVRRAGDGLERLDVSGCSGVKGWLEQDLLRALRGPAGSRLRQLVVWSDAWEIASLFFDAAQLGELRATCPRLDEGSRLAFGSEDAAETVANLDGTPGRHILSLMNAPGTPADAGLPPVLGRILQHPRVAVCHVGLPFAHADPGSVILDALADAVVAALAADAGPEGRRLEHLALHCPMLVHEDEQAFTAAMLEELARAAAAAAAAAAAGGPNRPATLGNSLRALTLSHAWPGFFCRVLAAAAGVRPRCLRMTSSKRLTPAATAAAFAAIDASALEVLSLNGANIGAEALPPVTRLLASPTCRLRKLTLRNCEPLFSMEGGGGAERRRETLAFCAAVGRNTSLRRLNLTGVGLEIDTGAVLGAALATRAAPLDRLRLCNNDLGSAGGVSAIVASARIASLNLMPCGLVDDGDLFALGTALECCATRVRHLQFGEAGDMVGDDQQPPSLWGSAAAARMLRSLAANKTLRTLCWSRHTQDEEPFADYDQDDDVSCVESLCSSVRANSTLRVLDLSGVALRKPEDLNRVADALRENRSVRLFSTGGFNDLAHAGFVRRLRGNTTLRVLAFCSGSLSAPAAAALGAELAGCGAALPALRHVALKDYLQPRYGRMSTPSVLALLGTAVPANERLTVHFLEDLTLPWFILDLSGGGVAAEEAAQEVALWDLDPNGGDPAAADAFAPLAQGLAALPLRLFERVRFKCTELRWEAGKALRDLAWPTEEEEREDGGAGAAAAAAGGATAAAGAGAGAAGSDREGGAGGAGVAVAAN